MSFSGIEKEFKNIKETLTADLSCPICQEIFRNPVNTTCGHSFCLACLLESIAPWSAAKCTQCPECSCAIVKQHPFSMNRALRGPLLLLVESEDEWNSRTVNDALDALQGNVVAILKLAGHYSMGRGGLKSNNVEVTIHALFSHVWSGTRGDKLSVIRALLHGENGVQRNSNHATDWMGTMEREDAFNSQDVLEDPSVSDRQGPHHFLNYVPSHASAPDDVSDMKRVQKTRKNPIVV